MTPVEALKSLADYVRTRRPVRMVGDLRHPNRELAPADVDLIAEALEAWAIIQELREPEGASVTLICDNPDFFGPNSAVDIIDDWTDWKERRFPGDSVIDALRAARAVRDACVETSRVQAERTP